MGREKILSCTSDVSGKEIKLGGLFIALGLVSCACSEKNGILGSLSEKNGISDLKIL